RYVGADRLHLVATSIEIHQRDATLGRVTARTRRAEFRWRHGLAGSEADNSRASRGSSRVQYLCESPPHQWIASVPRDHCPKVMPQLEIASMKSGGWPDASLPEHVSLGKFDRSVSLAAWAYNEEVLVESFLTHAINLLDLTVHDWEIVFVDDGSTDRTPEILREFAQREPRLRVVHHPRNLNVGMAFRTALATASKEYFFSQTVDWSYDLSRVRVFLELLKHFDAVQGIRPVPIRLLSYIPVVRSIYRIRRRSDTLYKAVISLANYYILRVLFGVRFHDFQNITFY